MSEEVHLGKLMDMNNYEENEYTVSVDKCTSCSVIRIVYIYSFPCEVVIDDIKKDGFMKMKLCYNCNIGEHILRYLGDENDDK